MIETVVAAAFFAVVIIACCATGGDSKSGTSKKSNANTRPRTTASHYSEDYCECPSCGAPYYDGYCEECGYPDVNQGWLGEEF